jgi:pyruvate-ferredoxin/flavodoxin oxidoreductase
MNYAAVDAALAGLKELTPREPRAAPRSPSVGLPPRYAGAPDFVQRITARLLAGKAICCPSAPSPLDGCWPTGTESFREAQHRPRDPAVGRLHLHPVQQVRAGLPARRDPRQDSANPPPSPALPPNFKSTPFKSNDFPDQRTLLQVAAEDCTGCSLCVQVCPAKDKTNPRHKAIDMVPQEPLLAAERANWDFFLALPDPDRTKLDLTTQGHPVPRAR